MTITTVLALEAGQLMPLQIDSIVKFIKMLHEICPAVGVMLLLTMADICFGICAACVTKTLSSTISHKGMVKKVVQLLWVGLGVAMEPYAGGMPLSGMIATCFAVTNVISIMENSVRAGVPVPKPVVDLLQQIRNNEKASVVTNPTKAMTVVEKASHVEIRTDIHADNEKSAVVVQGTESKSEK